MGSFSDFAEAATLACWFGGVAITPPATLYVALHTASVTDAGSGAEVTGGSYTRVAKTNNTTNFPAPTGTNPTTSQNGTTIVFPTATADWGTVVGVGLWDDPTAGNLVAWADLGTPKIVYNGDTPSFAIGAFTFQLT